VDDLFRNTVYIGQQSNDSWLQTDIYMDIRCCLLLASAWINI